MNGVPSTDGIVHGTAGTTEKVTVTFVASGNGNGNDSDGGSEGDAGTATDAGDGGTACSTPDGCGTTEVCCVRLPATDRAPQGTMSCETAAQCRTVNSRGEYGSALCSSLQDPRCVSGSQGCSIATGASSGICVGFK